jgi:hypothetical protein
MAAGGWRCLSVDVKRGAGRRGAEEERQPEVLQSGGGGAREHEEHVELRLRSCFWAATASTALSAKPQRAVVALPVAFCPAGRLASCCISSTRGVGRAVPPGPPAGRGAASEGGGEAPDALSQLQAKKKNAVG